jgi:hypothetical protein
LPWLHGAKPKDIAPLIFEASKKKKWTVAQALHNKGWITNIKMDVSLTMPHIQKYLSLWNRLLGVILHENNVDTIVWNLSTNGEYSLTSAYNAEFFTATLINFNKMVWKAWATPKG